MTNCNMRIIYRMLQLPLSDTEDNKKRNIIKQISIKNVYNPKTIFKNRKQN